MSGGESKIDETGFPGPAQVEAECNVMLLEAKERSRVARGTVKGRKRQFANV